mmetsp:Transcript_93026/g.249005  ORF Transcript_93026/g.249005 Transcript_93026/m.249005 type:complete len:699 (-) Transcript_93026:161-2257(-)
MMTADGRMVQTMNMAGPGYDIGVEGDASSPDRSITQSVLKYSKWLGAFVVFRIMVVTVFADHSIVKILHQVANEMGKMSQGDQEQEERMKTFQDAMNQIVLPSLVLGSLPTILIGICLGLIVPACGYYGAKNGNTTLVKCFTGCNFLCGCCSGLNILVAAAGMSAVQTFVGVALDSCDPRVCNDATSPASRLECFATVFPEYTTSFDGPRMNAGCWSMLNCSDAPQSRLLAGSLEEKDGFWGESLEEKDALFPTTTTTTTTEFEGADEETTTMSWRVTDTTRWANNGADDSSAGEGFEPPTTTPAPWRTDTVRGGDMEAEMMKCARVPKSKCGRGGCWWSTELGSCTSRAAEKCFRARRVSQCRGPCEWAQESDLCVPRGMAGGGLVFTTTPSFPSSAPYQYTTRGCPEADDVEDLPPWCKPQGPVSLPVRLGNNCGKVHAQGPCRRMGCIWEPHLSYCASRSEHRCLGARQPWQCEEGCRWEGSKCVEAKSNRHPDQGEVDFDDDDDSVAAPKNYQDLERRCVVDQQRLELVEALVSKGPKVLRQYANIIWLTVLLTIPFVILSCMGGCYGKQLSDRMSIGFRTMSQPLVMAQPYAVQPPAQVYQDQRFAGPPVYQTQAPQQVQQGQWGVSQGVVLQPPPMPNHGQYPQQQHYPPQHPPQQQPQQQQPQQQQPQPQQPQPQQQQQQQQQPSGMAATE